MKNLKLNPDLIEQFRNQFNKENFGHLRYSNRNNNNDFSAICSSMDWIETAMEYINNFKLSTFSANIISMEIFSFIMAVDIIYSCINTMHQVIFNKENPPFNDSNDIFKLNIDDKDDNTHFKKIRAAFGAHPTDLYLNSTSFYENH